MAQPAFPHPACAGESPDGPVKGQIYEYDFATKKKTRISVADSLEYRYPAIKGVVK